MRPFIRHRVCNGVGTFLLHDFWNPLGPILPFLGKGFFMTLPFIGMLLLFLSWMVQGGIGLLLSQLISEHLRTTVLTTLLIPLEMMLYLGPSL